MVTPVYSVNLTKEAFERLCEIRDYLCSELNEFVPLNQVCSTLIMQVVMPEDDL